MFEKVNPSHPDKLADRIAGAIVDYCYTQQDNPRVAVEVLIGHGHCTVIAESSVEIPEEFVQAAVNRIAGKHKLLFILSPQDEHLAKNQASEIRCGDNGIFRGCPINEEQRQLADIAGAIYEDVGTDGKYIISNQHLILCQSHIEENELRKKSPMFHDAKHCVINPLGYWEGGPEVDAGATNRKLGSDMGDAVTGGGLHGKDLSKADVSVNIWCHLLAQETGTPVSLKCAIGDAEVGIVPYRVIVEKAREYIKGIGGFEKFAEWGLIRPTIN